MQTHGLAVGLSVATVTKIRFNKAISIQRNTTARGIMNQAAKSWWRSCSPGRAATYCAATRSG